MDASSSIVMCLTTVSDHETATRIARDLVEESLAACVQVEGPIESHYRWEGKTCCETEYRLVIKSSLPSHSLIGSLRKIHPYDQPQIVCFLAVDVDAGYANWVSESCR